ncbi:MAG: hypothetical protein HY516_03890 [Candidatus Aenigmarchaeota archaeon]|nr:hypothetical protein [Candidatus Aenigmarchaeota archaeon]
MYEPARGKLHTYSVMLSPKPLAGVRFANPDIVRGFEIEMDMRWSELQGYIDTFAQRSACAEDSEVVEGMSLWKHSEGGIVMPVKGGLLLPPKNYGLVGIYDAVRVISGTGCGIDREMEVLFSVKDYGEVVEDVRKIVEKNLPPGISVSRASRLYSVDMEDGFSIRVRSGGL